MSHTALIIVLLAQVVLVGSQILLKHGMEIFDRPSTPRRRAIAFVGSGIACMTLWFFMWTGLLQRLEISRVFPFEGLSPVLLVLAACLLLREKVTWRVWMGVSLISLGTILVGLS